MGLRQRQGHDGASRLEARRRSGNALKDRKIDAFMFVAGGPRPRPSRTWPASPGMKMVLIGPRPCRRERFAAKYGPGLLDLQPSPKGHLSPTRKRPNKVAAVWNIMAVRERFFPEDLRLQAHQADA